MRIVLAMASITLNSRFTKFFPGDVTLATLQWFVFTLEREIGVRVVKLLFVKTHNLRVFPLVVGVTLTARLWLQCAVKSGLAFHVSAHFFVARRTKARLTLSIELDVTLSAVVL